MLTVLPPSWSLSARDKPIDAGRCKDYCINDRRAWLLVLADFRRQERRHSHSTFVLRAADCVAVDAVTREPCSARIFPLLTGKNTGNFAFSGASNCALLLGNPRPEPISNHCTCFRRISEQGINGEHIRELTGAQQRKNRELFLDGPPPKSPGPELVIRHP